MRRAVVIGIVLALGMVVSIEVSPPAGAATTTLAPTINTRVSGVNAGSVSALATTDQSGTQLDAAKVMTFGPGAHKNDRTYQLPGSIPEASVWGLTVRAHVRVPAKTQQTLTWFLRNATTNKWTKLDTNIEVDASEANTWYSLDFYALGTLADYISPTGEIKVRLSAPNKPYVTAIDSEFVEIAHGALPVNPGWHPPLGTRWQYELQPPVDTTVTGIAWQGGATVAPQAFDIDLYEADGVTPASATVAQIHALGAKAICYVSAGSWEDWRPDAAAYPAVVKGRSNGWPGEKWVDIRRLDILLPILSARVDACVAAGFDSVEFDNVDGVSNTTGFKLSQADQIRFNRALADLAHTKGLSVGLKNDLAQLTPLFAWFDYAINEQCSQYTECDLYDPWTDAGKHVVQVEYSASLAAFCPDAIAHGRSGIKKGLDLEATPYTPCN